MSSQERWTGAVVKANKKKAQVSVVRRGSSKDLLKDLRQGRDLSIWEPDLCIQLLRIPAAQNYTAVKKRLEKASK
uniref:Uncharacterized protein n=1 Tax=Timema cristinae TaxID=61476 RepID=A0A7R9H0J4_TIMCR|nr:unnamed protein product [Timema cristinae]